MATRDTNGTCSPSGCPTLPAAFVRLRYFYGKMLGVADLRDEQHYHIGQMRFHNRHLHGSGVVCGLALSAFDSDSPMLLRVARGAAVDACGRVVLVPYDMCIDLDAWFRRERERRGSEWPVLPAGDRSLVLAVTLRYRESPESPEPAPRDPCGPGSGGDEFGRVHEEFDLSVVPVDEAPCDERSSFPTRADLAAAIRGAATADELARELVELLTAGCPDGVDDAAICLGTLTAVVADPPTDGLDSWDPGTIEGPVDFLLATETLQELVLLQLEPRGTGSIAFDAAGRRFILTPPRPIEESSLLDDGTQFVLRRFDRELGWIDPPSEFGLAVQYDAEHVELDINDIETAPFLVASGRYRLSLEPGVEPIVDADLRAVPIEHGFRLVDRDGTLTLEPLT